ncbi:hypothetical protein, partial [Mesorhizobium sp. Cs1321R2N1]|uniref:hypothetical protein n=1 Tax=Mesorhizobium sp. Cs1321R2N1 TaxID=3015174 RepID=UPI00301D389E
VRLLVEEARHALPLPEDAQCERDARPVTATSTAGALPRSGFVLRPQTSRAHTRGNRPYRLLLRDGTSTKGIAPSAMTYGLGDNRAAQMHSAHRSTFMQRFQKRSFLTVKLTVNCELPHKILCKINNKG